MTSVSIVLGLLQGKADHRKGEKNAHNHIHVLAILNFFWSPHCRVRGVGGGCGLQSLLDFWNRTAVEVG